MENKIYLYVIPGILLSFTCYIIPGVYLYYKNKRKDSIQMNTNDLRI